MPIYCDSNELYNVLEADERLETSCSRGDEIGDGGKCEFSCSAGSRLDGPKEVTCSDGSWLELDFMKPKCLAPTCPNLA